MTMINRSEAACQEETVSLKNVQNIEIGSPASGGGQGKYMKYVSFPWPLLEVALSVHNVNLFVTRHSMLRTQ
jgi:hypothetical protein